MGVAGTRPPVVRPEVPTAGSLHADECDGDRTGGMLSFRMTLRNSSREDENRRPRALEERKPDDSSVKRLRLRAAVLSSSMLGLNCHRESSSRVSS